MNNRIRHTRDIQAPPTRGPILSQAGSRTLKTVLAILATIVLLTSALGYFTVGRIGKTVASGNLSLGNNGMKGKATDGATDILLVGSDSRTDAQGNPLTPQEIEVLHAGDEEADNTDTIMVIRVPDDGSSATAISIPRDTYIHDKKMGNLKINGVYSAYKAQEKQDLITDGLSDEQKLEEKSKDAGRKGLINAISDLTGITVDHYAEIGLLGFVLLTDAVGGVDVCLNDAVYDEYSGADFQAGPQTLNGAQGLAFVRQRHGLPRGDLDRIVRQQAYMASLVSKVLSSGTLANPGRLSSLSNAVSRSVLIDEDWDVMSFATQLQNLAGGNVSFNTIPVTSIDGTGDHGESVVTIDKTAVRDFFKSLLNDSPESDDAKNNPAPAENDNANDDQAAPSNEIHVLNASEDESLAPTVAQHLRNQNWKVYAVSTAEAGIYSESQVIATSQDDQTAQDIAKELSLPVTVNASLEAGTVIVVTADDYAGPTAELKEDDPNEQVGQPGNALGEESASPKIDADNTGPRCVN
ncbi:LytR family transcriptional regulator [Corynebacterium sp. sy017]|uniref:LCP family protein n=1 Tax=unclassified Corynebacterium TaxID=2624378 RepID=UPI001185E0A4|nr:MULTISPECIES: LCP family protein [unclassified Corynebacterium]MBP3088721.1 LytR family transcriptional regulator [Corynebacterium sp. sy017]TSD92005.1 LytR family transcriptional regulator [Corynebacterium sp. SY003]